MMDWITKLPIAHRGLHDAGSGVVENTASAVAAALEHGYAVEADLQLAGDGEAVVFHDFALGRLTQATGAVRDNTMAELRKVPLKDTRDRILSLGDLLDLVGGAVPLFLEIKSTWRGAGPLERRIGPVLARYKGPVAVMSFDPACMIAMQQAAPSIPRGMVSTRFRSPRHWSHLSFRQKLYLRHLFALSATSAAFVAYDIRALPALAPLVAGKMLGYPLLTWTVRPDNQEHAGRWADQIIFEGFRP